MNFKFILLISLIVVLSVSGCGYREQARDLRYSKKVLAKKKKSEDELLKVRKKLRRVIDMKIRAANMLVSVDRLLGRRYLENGNYLLAVDPLKEAEEIAPGNAFIKKDIGESYYLIGKSEVDEIKAKRYYELARKYLNKAIELQPDMVEAHYVMSLVLFFGFNDIDGAIMEAKRVLAEDSKNVDAHFALGRFYYEKGEYGKALNEYITITRILPRNSAKRKKAEENIIKINREREM